MAAILMIGKSAEFREIHEYYRLRKENPLKEMQSAVGNSPGKRPQQGAGSEIFLLRIS